MRSIQIRRHANTKKGAGRGKGSHPSAAGVTLARQIGGSETQLQADETAYDAWDHAQAHRALPMQH